jgi:dihydrolipoamide dehydrogenase
MKQSLTPHTYPHLHHTQANSDKLNVEKTGVKLAKRGTIKVDDCLRTTCEGVWAMGDCVGNYSFRHTANFEAEYLLRNVALAKETSQQPIDYAVQQPRTCGWAAILPYNPNLLHSFPSLQPIPHAVYAYPNMSGVGKTEQDLKEEGAQYVKVP